MASDLVRVVIPETGREALLGRERAEFLGLKPVTEKKKKTSAARPTRARKSAPSKKKQAAKPAKSEDKE